ncbi:MAG: phenylalanine--tRNA ligase subunit alpha [Calditrichia bacterium]
MKDKLLQSQEQAFSQLKEIDNAEALESFRLEWLSRKGLIQQYFEEFKTLPKEEKPEVGKLLNIFKNKLEKEFKARQKELQEASQGKDQIDLTFPGRRMFRGNLHPLAKTLMEIKKIFRTLGFTVADGPEIEEDYYNFEALNFPPDHPSRNMQDTLYITDNVLLRTHTSPVQVRVMKSQQPPVRIIAPGRVYRRDTPDASHSPAFHQVEGLLVDKHISFRDLKAILLEFAHKMFGEDINARFRPSFFPFTEPSLEVDFSCIFCRGKGCNVCKYTGWMEIAGAGMVDPNVFKAVGYDPEVYTGYAFGMGIDRIAMIKYNIKDIRLFFENNIRFLEQF